MEEKIKLITLSTNSWHYKLIKFMFGKVIPKPEKLQNLCPYFWILVASLIFLPITGPFILIGKMIKYAYNYFYKMWERSLEAKTIEWTKKLSTVDAYDLYDNKNNYYDHYLIKRPSFTNKYSTRTILKLWAQSQDIAIDENGEWEYTVEKMLIKHKEAYKQACEKENEANEARRKKNVENELKAAARREKLYNSFSFVTSFFKSIRSMFVFEDYTAIIKASRKIVGLLITAILSVASFFVVHTILFVIMWVIQIWDWYVIGRILIAEGFSLSVLAIIFGILWCGYKLITYIIAKREEGNVSGFISLLVYPAIGISYVFKYLIYYPLFFIFVSFIYKLIIIDILWGILKGFGVGLVRSTGIFGKYFGATKSDYCPGVEWKD